MTAATTLPVASVGIDLPFALLRASGRYAGPLGWTIDREFPRAAQWLESKFPLWAFSLVEDWAEGAFDQLGAVVFSRGDDAAQRLYYYLCELRERGLVSGPEPLIFDVAHIARASSEARSIDAVRRLAAVLGVSADAAEAAIAATPPPVPHTSGARNCLLAGTPAPDRRLHDAIARAGWTPHGATLAELWSEASAPLVEAGTGDPFAAIGRAVHQARTGPRAFGDRKVALAEAVRAAKASRAVLWYAEEDEAEVWNLPGQREQLQAMGVPALVLTRASWRADDGAPERIAAFLAEAEVAA